MKKKIINIKKDTIITEGVVVEKLPDNICKVKLKNNNIIKGYLSGNMCRNHIKIIKDDIVVIEITRFDKNRCRVIYRK